MERPATTNLVKNANQNDNWVKLWLASQNGYDDVVETLIKEGNVDVNKDSVDKGTTALMVASYNGHSAVVKRYSRKAMQMQMQLIRMELQLYMMPAKKGLMQLSKHCSKMAMQMRI